MDYSNPAEFDLSGFVGILAHDLANPLNAVSMNAELVRLLLEKKQPERAAEIVERVIADCARCTRFLSDMRAFADAVKQRPREAVSLHALADSAASLARAQTLVALPPLQFSGADPRLTVDRTAWESALAALMRNSAEAGASELRIDSLAANDDVTITLRDNGSGIPANIVGRIGQPFFTTRHAQGNTGLGVLLARYVVHAHGGELAYARNDDGGTLAQIRLHGTAAA